MKLVFIIGSGAVGKMTVGQELMKRTGLRLFHTGGTIALMLDWRIALVVWGGFLVLALITKWISLGSIWAGASFPFATWFVYHDVVLLVMGIFIGALVVWKHRGNLKRILKGEESKFSFHRKTGEKK